MGKEEFTFAFTKYTYSSPNIIRVIKMRRTSKSKTEKQFSNAFILQVFATGI